MVYKRKFRFVVATIACAISMTLGLVAGPAKAEPDEANFTTPTRNIDCFMFSYENEISANCEVKNAAWKTPKAEPADCELDWAPTEAYLESTNTDGAVANTVGIGVCRGDVGPACPPTCPILPYGKSQTIGIITCTSRKTGMTCVTNRGKRTGFTVSRSGYKIIK